MFITFFNTNIQQCLFLYAHFKSIAKGCWFSVLSKILVLCIVVIPAELFAADTITLQLRWHNQFQFAGYYAAIQQGYYRDAGLDVIIVEGQPDKKPVIEVLNANADYGVGNSEVLLSRLQGSPLVALAAIYQHSPSILLAKKSSKISSPHDLVGRSVMLMNQNIDADFMAMFHNEDIDLDSVDIIPSSYDIDDLVNGKTDVFNSYISNEPFYLEQRGIEYSIINPKLYGVDFYSDILFTTEDELKTNPERVKAFREASLKGWQYAFDHPQQIIDLLIHKYKTNKSKQHLEYEAREIEKLVLPKIVEIGHMNPWRWQHMAETFIDAGMVNKTDLLEGFDYQHMTALKQKKWSNIAQLTTVFSVFTFLMLAMMCYVYRKARREIHLRLKAEQALSQLAYTDSLTGLNNRHQFYILAEQALKSADRYNYSLAICFIDIDKFKAINDSYGHHIGDLVLQEFAAILKQNTRESDILSRIGGDEFVIILSNINETEASVLLDKIQNEINKPFGFGDTSLNVSASMGLSFYPNKTRDIDELINLADGNMYQNKHAAHHDKTQ
jgi:diguanylate cyclase (GGDEF)-like protein